MILARVDLRRALIARSARDIGHLKARSQVTQGLASRQHANGPHHSCRAGGILAGFGLALYSYGRFAGTRAGRAVHRSSRLRARNAARRSGSAAGRGTSRPERPHAGRWQSRCFGDPRPYGTTRGAQPGSAVLHLGRRPDRRLLASEIIKAADRGVRVRLLLDDINAQGLDRAHLALDEHPNIAVRLFNPSRNREAVLRRGVEMLLRAVSITRRMHNKAWIADGRLAVVGGRNIGDAYCDAAATANFRDLDVLVLGAAVREGRSCSTITGTAKP